MNDRLTEVQLDAICEVGNISMGTASTTLSTVLGKRVKITTPAVEVVTLDEIAKQYPGSFVLTEVAYTSGFEGLSLFILKQDDAKIIADLVMGGEGTVSSEDLTELQLSAIGEIMNQMIGTAATSMSRLISKTINITPPKTSCAALDDEKVLNYFDHTSNLVKIGFQLEVNDTLIKSEFVQLVPVEFAKFIANNLTGVKEESVAVQEVMATSVAVATVAQPTVSRPQTEFRNPEPPSKKSVTPSQMVEVAPPNYPAFNERGEEVASQPENVGILMDVALNISIELGRTKKTIKEIVELNQGSLIVLDRVAGEPVDIVANGKLIARGDVIVIDDNYGVRITDIIKTEKRIPTF